MIKEKEISNCTSDTSDGNIAMPPRRRHRAQKERGKFFWLRNTLNLIFIIGALIGMLTYFFCNEDKGIVIVLAAMAFKMCECVIRLLK